MNAIVSVYKNFILTLLFLTLVGGLLAVMVVATTDVVPGASRVLIIGAIIGATLLSFLLIASSAIIISIHDRHNEIAEGIHRIAEALEARAQGGQIDAH